jgi:hypothetical protein
MCPSSLQVDTIRCVHIASMTFNFNPVQTATAGRLPFFWEATNRDVRFKGIQKPVSGRLRDFSRSFSSFERAMSVNGSDGVGNAPHDETRQCEEFRRVGGGGKCVLTEVLPDSLRRMRQNRALIPGVPKKRRRTAKRLRVVQGSSQTPSAKRPLIQY